MGALSSKIMHNPYTSLKQVYLCVLVLVVEGVALTCESVLPLFNADQVSIKCVSCSLFLLPFLFVAHLSSTFFTYFISHVLAWRRGYKLRISIVEASFRDIE
ncbi:hypothetical protein EGR_08322 [Echinococcus granulosus]|uniref:Uncharacterized protein n=1 Tax=Echinococcus granulosus TaxID=6210 RepID=W6U6E0_ECHGR|nr:hypothetical protein EGR_08322 [Echinococcus granulosus]EUB56798.1 hypothetical protein EGR_08322 [Echinococcus granulosus]